MISRISQSTNGYQCLSNLLGTTENRKNFLDFEDGERKGWTIFETTDNPDAGVGMIAVFRADGGMTRCLGSCPDGGGTIPPC
jgi:hypothetical protein